MSQANNGIQYFVKVAIAKVTMKYKDVLCFHPRLVKILFSTFCATWILALPVGTRSYEHLACELALLRDHPLPRVPLRAREPVRRLTNT